jgi:hypothetical protein
VMLRNIGDSNGTVDIAFDAMAFVPLGTNGKGHKCKDPYK